VLVVTTSVVDYGQYRAENDSLDFGQNRDGSQKPVFSQQNAVHARLK